MSSGPAEHPPISVEMQSTPNPNSFRFAVNRVLAEGPGQDFPDAPAAADVPLAKALFDIPGVRGVYIGPAFVTVTVEGESSWVNLKNLVSDLITVHVEREPQPAKQSAPESGGMVPETDLEKGVAQILDAEIRPAVAMDGGDIQLVSIENNVVLLRLRGACSGCPSSLMTLKDGIETRLKKTFPEIVAVEAES